MSYEVNILADSRHPEAGARLTTFEVVFPRFILAEVNTHRMLSRNGASSRAIPTERFIESLTLNPFVPEFNERVKGMGIGALLTPELQFEAETIWLDARDDMLNAARALMEIGVDKSRANRLLEPFMWHTAIISATDWENFFALRTHETAQKEFRIIAQMMQAALKENQPKTLTYNEWHIPLLDEEDFHRYGTFTNNGKFNGDWYSLKDIAVGRLARRSSYDRTDPEPDEKSIERTKMLSKGGHWSPFEHVARPMYGGRKLTREVPEDWSGNFFGWHQYRKDFTNEDNYARMVSE